MKKHYRFDGPDFVLVATVRYDDECKNGHKTFAITGDLYDRTHRVPFESSIKHKNGRTYWLGSCGCLHDGIARYFPDLGPLIKWHLCSTDGPTHYLANTMYHAGDKDCWGLRKGQCQSFAYAVVAGGETLFTSLAFRPPGGAESHKKAEDFAALLRPEAGAEIVLTGLGAPSEGKQADLEAARRCAIWPGATLEQLQDEEALKARLPALLAEFRAAVESLGFEY